MRYPSMLGLSLVLCAVAVRAAEVLRVTTAAEDGASDFRCAVTAAEPEAVGAFSVSLGVVDWPLDAARRIACPPLAGEYAPLLSLEHEGRRLEVMPLDYHSRRRPDEHVLELRPQDGKTELVLHADRRFADRMASAFSARWRLRFDGDGTFADYRAELDRNVPPRPQPLATAAGNPVVIAGYFLAERNYRTPDNPQGYLLKDPRWKDNPWEWGHEQINSAMAPEEIERRSGFADRHFGDPVRWIVPYAERCVREMKESGARAYLVYRSALNPGGNDYIPESSAFHPLLEAELPDGRGRAIDVWARILSENNVEFGFLVRSADTIGQPWAQRLRPFDWTSLSDYERLQGRLKALTERFGKHCRWFYLDEFGATTPRWVFERLRAEFPDAVFIAGQPTDVSDRFTVGFRRAPRPTALEALLNPQAHAILSPEAFPDYPNLFPEWRRRDHLLLMTHRAARTFKTLGEKP